MKWQIYEERGYKNANFVKAFFDANID